MSDKDKTPPAPPAPQPKAEEKVSKKDLVVAHFAKLREHLLGSDIKKDINGNESLVPRFKGQPGYNPFLYIQQVIVPYEQKIETGTITDGELDLALKLPLDVKPDGNSIKVNQIKLRDYIEANKREGKNPKVLTS